MQPSQENESEFYENVSKYEQMIEQLKNEL